MFILLFWSTFITSLTTHLHFLGPLVHLMVAPALYMANGYGCSLLLLFYYLSNIPIQNRFVLATGLAEQLTIRCFANPL